MHATVPQSPAFGAAQSLHTTFPDPSLIVLIGAAGSGKSTWARTWPSTQVLELDHFRALVSDCAGDQAATADAVAALHTVLEARLARKRTTVVDATHTEERVRTRLVQAARRHGVPAVAFVVPALAEVCVQRQAGRSAERAVPEAVVRRQHAEAVAAFPQLHDEGFDRVVFADSVRRLELLLKRAADTRRRESGWDGDAGQALIRRVLGAELLPLWQWREAPAFTGCDRIGEIRLGGDRMILALRAGVLDLLVPCPYDEACTAPAWQPVHCASDLLAAYTATRPHPDTCCTVHGGPDDHPHATLRRTTVPAPLRA
ncbi:ATP-binding protein [Streptomyces sp. NPDC006743]|uniref:ATP-binding protein n=1 Tax=Streptomyces sp. NPDC006743 TaxID=3154480 RepID=UPI003455C8A9